MIEQSQALKKIIKGVYPLANYIGIKNDSVVFLTSNTQILSFVVEQWEGKVTDGIIQIDAKTFYNLVRNEAMDMNNWDSVVSCLKAAKGVRVEVVQEPQFLQFDMNMYTVVGNCSASSIPYLTGGLSAPSSLFFAQERIIALGYKSRDTHIIAKLRHCVLGEGQEGVIEIPILNLVWKPIVDYLTLSKQDVSISVMSLKDTYNKQEGNIESENAFAQRKVLSDYVIDVAWSGVSMRFFYDEYDTAGKMSLQVMSATDTITDTADKVHDYDPDVLQRIYPMFANNVLLSRIENNICVDVLYNGDVVRNVIGTVDGDSSLRWENCRSVLDIVSTVGGTGLSLARRAVHNPVTTEADDFKFLILKKVEGELFLFYEFIVGGV